MHDAVNPPLASSRDELRSASYIPTPVSELRLNACQLGALGIKLGLEGKSLAQSRLVIGKPTGCIQCQPLLLLKIQLEPLQDVLQARNQPERGQVGLDSDLLVARSALQDQCDPEGSSEGRMGLAGDVEAAEASDTPLPLGARTLGKTQLGEEESAGRLALGDHSPLPFQCECLASCRHAPRQVLTDGGNPLFGSVAIVSCVLDLPPDVELVVEVRGALPFQAPDLAFEARLLDQSRVARGDRLGERKLVGLVVRVFERTGAAIA